MKKFYAFLLTLLTVFTLGIGLGVEAAAGDAVGTDTLNSTVFKMKASYQNYDSQNLSSGTAYRVYGYSQGDIQLNSANKNGHHSGIINTNTVGVVSAMEVTFQKAEKGIAVFGSENPYNSTDDLYNEATQGELIGLADANGAIDLDLTNQYPYVGIASVDGSINIISLKITWVEAGPKTEYKVSFNAGDGSFVEGKGQPVVTPLGEQCPAITLPTLSDINVPNGFYFDYWTDGVNNYNPGDEYLPELDKDVVIKAVYGVKTITIEEAIKICEEANGNETTVKFTVLGQVVDTPKNNKNFYISDGQNKLYAYKSMDKCKDGQFVELNGVLQKYQTKYEIKNATVKVINEENYFKQRQTNSSLAITYDDANRTLESVKIRFGGIIDDYSYNGMNEYGVIVLPGSSTDDLTNVTAAKLAEYKNSKFAVKATPARVEKGYQFAAVITNVEGHFDFEFRAVMYMVNGNKVVTTKETKNSVIGIRDEYLQNSSLSGIYDILNLIK